MDKKIYLGIGIIVGILIGMLFVMFLSTDIASANSLVDDICKTRVGENYVFYRWIGTGSINWNIECIHTIVGDKKTALIQAQRL